jgi:hypothetical protein
MGGTSVTGNGSGSASNILNPVAGLGPLTKVFNTSNQVPVHIVNNRFIVENAPVGTSTLLFQPNGIQGANVFNNWPDLYQAALQIRGSYVIEVDSRFGTAIVPAGTYDLTNATLYATVNSVFNELHFADGAKLTALGGIKGNINIFSDSTTPVLVYKDMEQFLLVENFASITSTNTGPFIQLDNAQVLIILSSGINIFNLGGIPINLINNSVLKVYVNFFCVINPNVFSGPNGTITVSKYEASSTVSNSQPAFLGTFTIVP